MISTRSPIFYSFTVCFFAGSGGITLDKWETNGSVYNFDPEKYESISLTEGRQ